MCIRDSSSFDHLVDCRFHVVVDATLWNTTQSSECSGMSVIQHFMSLRWISRKGKCATGAQLGMCSLNFAMNTANHQPFIAPIKLEGISKFEFERHISRFA